MKNSSQILVQVYDQKKFKKKDQGFLGLIKVQMDKVFDVSVGGDGKVLSPQLLHLESYRHMYRMYI